MFAKSQWRAAISGPRRVSSDERAGEGANVKTHAPPLSAESLWRAACPTSAD
jgi:hypothetical protein